MTLCSNQCMLCKTVWETSYEVTRDTQGKPVEYVFAETTCPRCDYNRFTSVDIHRPNKDGGLNEA